MGKDTVETQATLRAGSEALLVQPLDLRAGFWCAVSTEHFVEHAPHLSDVINMLALLAAAVGSCALLAAKYVHESGLRRQQYLEDLADEPTPVSDPATEHDSLSRLPQSKNLAMSACLLLDGQCDPAILQLFQALALL